MTKAELLAAIADAPDDAEICIDDGNDGLRSCITMRQTACGNRSTASKFHYAR